MRIMYRVAQGRGDSMRLRQDSGGTLSEQSSWWDVPVDQSPEDDFKQLIEVVVGSDIDRYLYDARFHSDVHKIVYRLQVAREARAALIAAQETTE